MRYKFTGIVFKDRKRKTKYKFGFFKGNTNYSIKMMKRKKK